VKTTPIWERLKRSLLLPLRFPTVLVLSVAYSGLLYAASLQAGLLDVRSPYWVWSVASLLLLSPVLHAILIPMIAASLHGARVQWRTVLGDAVMLFPRLFLGELIIGAAVIAGGLLFLLPGIYIGMRFIYYKQAIILGRRSVGAALRESLRSTADWRPTGGLLICLVALYGAAVGLDSALVAFAPATVIHIGAVAGSSLLLAWLNVLITSAWIDREGDA
jgi:hypothetical protein